MVPSIETMVAPNNNSEPIITQHGYPLSLRRTTSDASIDVKEGFAKLFLDQSNRVEAKRKNTFFCRNVEKKETIHRFDYTPEERNNYWMTAGDLQQIKLMNNHTVQLFKTGALRKDTDLYCSRGLEHRIDKESSGRKQRRNAARRAVMNQQKYASKDPEKIADCYRKVTAASGLRAYNRGVVDEMEAKRLLKPAAASEDEQSRRKNEVTSKNKSKRNAFHKMFSLFRTNLNDLGQHAIMDRL